MTRSLFRHKKAPPVGCFFAVLAQLFAGILIQMYGAVEIFGAAAGTATAGTGAGTGAGAAAGAGTVAAAAESAAAKAATAAAAAEAALPAAALGRAGPGFGTHAAGPGPAAGAPRVPQAIDEHIPGAEAAHITAYGGEYGHDEA